MKKVILTFALFSLVVLTSFTTTETQTKNMVVETSQDTGGTGTGQVINGNKKLDYTGNTGGDTGTGQVITGNKKLDYADNTRGESVGQVISGNKKLDNK